MFWEEKKITLSTLLEDANKIGSNARAQRYFKKEIDFVKSSIRDVIGLVAIRDKCDNKIFLMEINKVIDTANKTFGSDNTNSFIGSSARWLDDLLFNLPKKSSLYKEINEEILGSLREAVREEIRRSPEREYPHIKFFIELKQPKTEKSSIIR